MNIKHYLKHQHSPLIKFVIYGVTAVFAIIAFVVFMNTYLPSSKASQARVDISFGPDKVTMKTGESKSVTLKLFAAEGKKIMAFDVKVNATGAVVVKSIGKPKAIGGDVLFTELVHTADRLSAIVDLPAGGVYPSAIYMPVEIQAIKPGSGELMFVKNKSQVVGDVTGYEYALNPKNTVTVKVLYSSPYGGQ